MVYQRPEDYVQQLAEYIKKNLAKGYTMDSLKFSLKTQGYSRVAIDRAIELTNKQLAEQAPVMQEKPEIVYRSFVTEPVQEKKGFWKKIKNWFK